MMVLLETLEEVLKYYKIDYIKYFKTLPLPMDKSAANFKFS